MWLIGLKEILKGEKILMQPWLLNANFFLGTMYPWKYIFFIEIEVFPVIHLIATLLIVWVLHTCKECSISSLQITSETLYLVCVINCKSNCSLWRKMWISSSILDLTILLLKPKQCYSMFFFSYHFVNKIKGEFSG